MFQCIFALQGHRQSGSTLPTPVGVEFNGKHRYAFEVSRRSARQFRAQVAARGARFGRRGAVDRFFLIFFALTCRFRGVDVYALARLAPSTHSKSRSSSGRGVSLKRLEVPE